MLTVADTIRDLSLRQAVRLAGWENGLVAETIRLLDQADLELEARIARAIEDKAATATVRRLKDLRDELRAVNLGAYRTAGKHLTAELADFGARLAPATADAMESALPFAFSFTRPSPQLLRSIITSQPFQGALIGEHIDALAGNRLGALMRETEQGLLQGDSLSQILIRIRGRKVGKRFVGGVLDAHRVGRPALEALTRTATAHVQTTAQQRLYEENSDLVRGVVWTATLDHRTCPQICQPRDGKPYEYDPETGAYRPYKHGLAWLFGPGRSHWNDRCTSIAWLRSLDAFEQAGIDVSKLADGERAAMGGPVPVSETYETWLPKQPREIQEIALGKRRAAELRSGKALGEIWRTFQARAVAPVALEEALPVVAQPLTIAEVKAELKAIEKDVQARSKEALLRRRELRDEWETRKAELSPEGLQKVVDDALDEMIREEDLMRSAQKVGDAAKEAAARARLDAALKRATDAEMNLAKETLGDTRLQAIEDEIAALNVKQKEILAELVPRAHETLMRNKRPTFIDHDSANVVDWQASDALTWISSVTGRGLEGRRLFIRGVTGRSNYGEGEVSLRHGSSPKTLVHELGHWLEEIFPDIHSKCLRFLRRRTEGEAREHMGPGYDSWEFTRPDKFLDRYMGKDYGSRATEILSMGLELLYSDPWGLLADEDYFDFILGLLGHQ